MPVMVAGRFRSPPSARTRSRRARPTSSDSGVRYWRTPSGPEGAGRAGGRDPAVHRVVQDCRRAIGLIGCTIHARTGREHEWGPEHASRRSDSRARVVVAGGGAAGLETARLAAQAGHEVVLFERAGELGGQLRVAAAGPTREELLDFVFYSERELGRLGVDVRPAIEATAEVILAEAARSVRLRDRRDPLAPSSRSPAMPGSSTSGSCSAARSPRPGGTPP